MVAAGRKQLGPYLVLERIGVGAMAVVDRALERELEGTEHVERVVALKRLLPSLAQDEEIVRGFVREARLASLLSHANVAQVYALGRVGTEYFIAMEYVDGCSLAAIVRRARTEGVPPLPLVVAIVRQICLALDHAHHQRDAEGQPLGLVHRDLSPTNVLVSRTGHVKVIDFGIARAVKLHSERASGKLAYMSPEALAGDSLDHRSDLFSLGVMFHELLTGRSLFDGEVDRAGERRTIAPPTAHHQGLPPEIDAIVMKALDSDPAERWSTAADLRAALDKVCPTVATESEIAAWCQPVFDEIDANDNRSVPPLEPSSSGRVLEAIDSGNTTGVVLADVPDYAEYSVAPRTTVGHRPARPGDVPAPPASSPLPSIRGTRATTIETHAVPPPLTPLPTPTRVSREATQPRLDEAAFTTSRPSVSRIDARESAVWRAVTRVDLRIVFAAVVVSVAIGIVVLGSGNHATSPSIGRADTVGMPAATPPAPLAPLAPTTGTVTIDVTPPAAAIVVDSLPPHTGSPWKLELTAGAHQLAISAPEFDAWRTALVVRAGETQLVRVALASTLKPAVTSSTLSLDSYPPGLEVVFDGEPLATRTPIRMGIGPGGHTIVVHDAAGEVWSTAFVAKPNHHHRFTAARPVRTGATTDTDHPAPDGRGSADADAVERVPDPPGPDPTP
jgi:eukaryotic-like serine/threonine-protein kinase